MYIDTHVHLNNPDLLAKVDEVINSALSQGVTKFIVPGYDFETSRIALELAHKYPFIYATIGYHPTEIKGYGEKEYKWLEENVSDSKVVAIGEVGFDFHWDSTTKEEQTDAFIRQIEIAKKANKPLVIHSRDAIGLTYETLKKHNAAMVGGVMHCYSGSLEMAPLFIKENFYLGVDGPVTFSNAKEIVKVVKEMPLEWLVTETDSPYLTPHPYRGKENQPKYIPLIANKISEIKGMEITEVAQALYNNAQKLFRLE